MFDTSINQQHISELELALYHEFETLYKKYHSQNIYAFVLVLDVLAIPQYTLTSTYLSIFNDDEDRIQYLAEKDKWEFDKWRYRTQPQQSLSSISKKISHYLQQTQFNNSTNSSATSLSQNLMSFYLQSFERCISRIKSEFSIELEQIVFAIYQPNQPQTTLTSLQKLNQVSPIRDEVITHIQNLQQQSKKKSYKLSEIDKEILIDLGQILEIEPYDELMITHQAYLLTLEPYFAEANPYIQHLIHDIVAMNDGVLMLTKFEIQTRIHLFYL